MSYGDTAFLIRGEQADPLIVIASDINIALSRPIFLLPGYGFLPAGTLVGEVTEASDGRLGAYVPRSIVTPATAKKLPYLGGAYLLADGAADAVAKVAIEDSYMFAVGDHLLAVDSDASPVDLGAIVSIDRTTYSHMAIITATNNVTTGITVAKGGMIAIQTKTTTPFTTALGVLVGGYDTGRGSNARGANAAMALSNIMLRRGCVPNYDATALSDLSGVASGDLIVLK